MAIGCGFGGDVRGDCGASARPVFNDHLLAPALGELLREVARKDVARGARRTGNDAYRFRRVILSVTGCRDEQDCTRDTQCSRERSFYDILPLSLRTSACASQNRMSMSRYSVVAVVRFSSVCWRLPVRP